LRRRRVAGVPAIYPYREVTQADGLLSYGTNITDIVRQAGVMAGKVLKGAKPGRPASASADQVRISHQPQDGEGARPGCPANAARTYRRGDRVDRDAYWLAPIEKAVISGAPVSFGRASAVWDLGFLHECVDEPD